MPHFPLSFYSAPAMLISKSSTTGLVMTAHVSKDPLHGITLEMQLNALVARYGWGELGKLININCFKNDPSVKSSLKFLRRTPWARAEVEALYLYSLDRDPLDDAVPEKQDEPALNPWANSRLNKS